uniref:Uncharacterized protein n=1 Tax=Anguilla anguilla TaxID=7936 RepID=A0A0E9VDW9_ANGAN
MPGYFQKQLCVKPHMLFKVLSPFLLQFG